MTPDTEFSWETLELEERQRKGKLLPEDYSKLGYSKDIVDAYESTYDRLSYIPQQNALVRGTITSVGPEGAVVDINYTEDAYIDLSKEDKRYLEYLQPGFDITVKIVDDPEDKGFINTSFTAGAKAMKEQEILDSIGDDVAYMGYVDRLVAGGYIVNIDDIESFMPGSLAGVNKLHDFSVLLGQELLVKPVNFERGNIVVSHRDYLRTLIPTKIEELKENTNQNVTGFVTGTTKYGVFCEFNECLTGMILVSDLTDEWKDRHLSQDIKPGDEIDFFVKEIVSTKKIILTQVIKYDPWTDITERYTVPCEVEGTVTSIKEYGAFIKIEDDIVGLLHQSEFAEMEFEEGQTVKVKITRIDQPTKKVFLKLP
jgi:ribosomal protein S1